MPLALLLACAGPALAQFKVVAPDGTVTYTDRPAASPGSKVTQLRKDASALSAQAPGPAASTSAGTATAASLARLPYELRQVAERFAVVLYASADCAPCDAGRRLLLRRGVPYTERLIQTEEDQQALAGVSGARTVPVLSVGSQVSRGWSDSEWSANLDLAGYPQQSRLPRDWPVALATPLTPRPATAEPAPAQPAAPANEAAPAPEVAPGSVRF